MAIHKVVTESQNCPKWCLKPSLKAKRARKHYALASYMSESWQCSLTSGVQYWTAKVDWNAHNAVEHNRCPFQVLLILS